jgi:hypothetical protein
MRLRHPLSLVAVLTVCLLSVVAPARADFAERPDRVQLYLGGTAAEFSTEAGLGASNGAAGVSINFEDLFDLPIDKTAARLDGAWKISERQYIDFGYVKFDRTAARNVAQDFTWGDNTILAGAYVESSFNTTFPYAAWRYDFLHLDQVRISGSAGITYLNLSTDLTATGDLVDINGMPYTGTYAKGASIQFPTPLFGLQLDWALRRHLVLTFFNRLLYINFAGIRGGIEERTIRLKWAFTKYFGLAVGLDKNSIVLREYDTGDYKASFNYTVQGFSGYLTFQF